MSPPTYLSAYLNQELKLEFPNGKHSDLKMYLSILQFVLYLVFTFGPKSARQITKCRHQSFYFYLQISEFENKCLILLSLLFFSTITITADLPNSRCSIKTVPIRGFSPGAKILQLSMIFEQQNRLWHYSMVLPWVRSH